MGLRIILLFSLLFLTACNSTIDSTEKEKSDGVNASSEIEVYSREIAEEEQEYIQLVLKDEYDTLYSKTKAKVNEVQQDYNNIAFAFRKYEEVQPLEDEIWNYTSIHLKYSNMLESIESIKFIPNEIKEKVNGLYEIATEKKEYWAEIKENEKGKSTVELQLELEKEIDERTDNPQSVSIGMTKEEVLTEGWGRPKDINKTTTAYGVSEQWVYDNYNYLYFEDGILTTIQN